MDFIFFSNQFGFSIVSICVIFVLSFVFGSYIKIATVLSFVRTGIGAFGLPSIFVVGILSLALSFFIVKPVFDQIAKELQEEIKVSDVSEVDLKVKVITKSLDVWKSFILKHTNVKDINTFANIAKKQNVSVEVAKNSWQILAPAFIVSELRQAFKTGLSLLMPFLIIELLVAHALTAIGSQKVSPEFVSLPFKIGIFVALDGWSLITANLVNSYTI